MSSLPFETDTERRSYPTPDEKKKGVEIPQIEPYWEYDDTQVHSAFPGPRRLMFLVFRFLCLIAFGSGNLGTLWNACYDIPQGLGEEKKKEREKERQGVWEAEAKRVKERLDHLNTVVRPQIVDRRFAGSTATSGPV